MDVAIERSTAAFCGRVETVTVVIGVSLVMENARYIEIVCVCVKIRRWMGACYGILIALAEV